MTAKVFETYREIGEHEVDRLAVQSPYCFNDTVHFRRYRVTIEAVEEPVEVLAARLQRLWDESDNIHHRPPIKLAAERIGYALQGPPGGRK